MKTPIIASIILVASCLLNACYSSSGLTGDVSLSDAAEDTIPDAEDDAPPDVAEIDVEPDLPPHHCRTDADCAVALHEDRCCHTCPLVVNRDELAADPCLHELGTSFDYPIPTSECMFDCYACLPCSEPPVYAAECAGGACVPVEDACDLPETTPAVPAMDGTDFLDPEGEWTSHAGTIVSVTGSLLPGPDSCACCFDCFCDCYDRPVRQTVDCAIVLRGNLCGDVFACTGTECDGSCTPVSGPGTIGAVGFLVPNELNHPELWVTEWGMYF